MSVSDRNPNDSNSPEPSNVTLGVDLPSFQASAIWNALSCTPGVGLSVIDTEGRLLFVNDLTSALFLESNLDYQGKTLADFHPPEFVEERLRMIRQCIDQGRPLGIDHIYHGNPIGSVLWPIPDAMPPHGRVIVVSRLRTDAEPTPRIQCETVATNYIGLGPLSVLTRRELEVLAILGHGLTVPEAARMLHRSPKTVERHKDSISRKLSLHGQAELVEIVTRMGLEISDATLKRYPE
ncbi:MAG: LuxR C-terminal-related transcriptional regulator [Planctomycetota bacterium]